MKFTAICILLLLFSQGAAAQQVLRIGLYQGAQNLDSVGIIKVLPTWLAQLGYQLEYVILPADRSLRSVQAGMLDGDIGRLESQVEELSQVILVEPAIFHYQAWLLVAADRHCPWVDDLTLARPVGVRGVRYFEHFYQNAKNGYLQTDSWPHVVELLYLARADYTIASLDVFQQAAAWQQPLKLCGEQPLLSSDVHLVLHQRHQQLAQQLSPYIQQWLAQRSP